MSLRDLLLSILSGGIALGPTIYVGCEYFGVLNGIDPKHKRIGIAALAGIISLAAWGLALYLGYVPGPADRQGIAEAIWSNGIMTALAAFTSSTVIHGAVKLKSEGA